MPAPRERSSTKYWSLVMFASNSSQPAWMGIIREYLMQNILAWYFTTATWTQYLHWWLMYDWRTTLHQ